MLPILHLAAGPVWTGQDKSLVKESGKTAEVFLWGIVMKAFNITLALLFGGIALSGCHTGRAGIHLAERAQVMVDPNACIGDVTAPPDLKMVGSANRDMASKSCWLEEPTLDNVDLVIRTVNTKQGGSYYAKRLYGIGQEFFNDWPYQVGIIGMQEVKQEMDACPVGEKEVHGARCFAQILGNLYGENCTYARHKPLGTVVGSDWEISIEPIAYELGKDSWNKFGNRSTRYLLYTLLRHRTEGWMLRFYTTHLSHGQDQKGQRRDQIKKLRKIVKEVSIEGELTPVVVGDFNFSQDSNPNQFDRMNEDFWLANSKGLPCADGMPANGGIDHIWVGRASSFPQAKAKLTVVRYHTEASGYGIDLQSSHSVDGYVGPLSDHDSPGISFRIDSLLDSVYVDSSAKGDGDGTAERPFTTVRLGVIRVDIGGDVIIRGGSYHEQLTIDKPVRLRAYPDSGAVLVGGKLRLSPPASLRVHSTGSFRIH